LNSGAPLNPIPALAAALEKVQPSKKFTIGSKKQSKSKRGNKQIKKRNQSGRNQIVRMRFNKSSFCDFPMGITFLPISK
jgi:hypothetical protein